MRLGNRVAIVTGGAGRIGTAIIRRFHQEGAKVAIVDQDEARIAAAYDEAGVPSDARLSIAGDVALEETAVEMAEKTVKKFGRLDSVVTAVFWSKRGDATEIELDEWNRCMAVTLTSTFLAIKHSVPVIIDTAGSGSVTAISSIHGTHPGDRYAMYATAKAGLNMMIQAMALDFTPKGVRVNGVAPGATLPDDYDEGPQRNSVGMLAYPLGRPMRAHEIADAVLFLTSDEASAITGQTILVDGGVSIPLADMLVSKSHATVMADPARFGVKQ